MRIHYSKLDTILVSIVIIIYAVKLKSDHSKVNTTQQNVSQLALKQSMRYLIDVVSYYFSSYNESSA